MNRFAVPSDAEGRAPAVGLPPENRRQAVIKLLWISLWMIYLWAPVSDLLDRGHSLLASVLAGLGLAFFVGTYLLLVFRHMKVATRPVVYGPLAVMLVLAVVLSATFGTDWLVLFVYFTISVGAVLPPRRARWGIVLGVAVLVAQGLGTDPADDLWPQLVIPALLGALVMVGIRQMIRTTRELREARATVAQLAAGEERLRLARDLHDLLGHSLSLITLKSELAGRMLPGDPEGAASQVADIERVSRQALVDVREAVSDYRRPTLEIELAGARTALEAAGVSADLPRLTERPALHPDQESAIAWALREATTNVIRHSGAGRCTVTLTEQADDTVCLTVTDNGHGPSATGGLEGPGNGLAGLAERLALADGTLETGAGVRGGFRLRATVPASPGPRTAAGTRPVTLPT